MALADYSFLPFGAGGIPANENSGTAFAAPRFYFGTTAPTTAAAPAAGYNLGDIVFNVNQSTGAPLAWVCTTGGTSFVFSAVGSSGNTPVSTVTAGSGTLAPTTSGSAVILLNPATTGTYSLPEASSQTSGTRLTVKNIAVGPVTLTPLGTDQYEGGTVAAITLVQDQGVELFASGTTQWYNETNAAPRVQTTTATSGTLTNYQSYIFLNPASTGTYSLPAAEANFAGFRMTIKNLASGSTTLTPLGSNNYADAAAITLAQFGVVNLVSAGSTSWYKAA